MSGKPPRVHSAGLRGVCSPDPPDGESEGGVSHGTGWTGLHPSERSMCNSREGRDKELR